MITRLLRMTGTIQSRFMVAVATMLVVLMTVIIFAVNQRLGSLLIGETRAKGVAIAQSIGATTTNALLNYDYVSLGQAAEKAVGEGGIAYVVILDKEGKVAARARQRSVESADGPLPDVRTERGGDGRDRPAVRSTRIRVAGEDCPALDVAYPVYVPESDVRWGTVRIGLNLRPMHRAMQRVRLILLGIGVAGAMLALVVGRAISHRIGRSVEDLVRGTIEISRGNLDHRIEAETDDEIATLARHFNHMTEQVKKQQDEIAVAKGELEVLNATLEEKVARRTQEFLASEEKYRILVNHSPDPIVINQGGVIRFVNPAFVALLGYDISSSPGRELRALDLFHSEDRTRAEEFFTRILRDEPVDAGEFRGRSKDGQTKVFEMRGMRIQYMDEPAVELILMDTTEKKELQDTLVRHEKLRALGELASGVAHDFNNILGIILGRAQLLQKRATDEEARKGLRTIERAAFDGGETVRRIQDFARSRTERDFEDIDLCALLEEVVEITRTRWRDQAEVRNVRIDVCLDLSPVQNVKGNGSELREVYTNLIFNAVDAMPGGGTISITSRMDGADTVVLVRDTGKGMDGATRSRIFDPFFSTKGEKGMGLGMSVVYGIIERHRGQISVESEPGEGTCFCVRIPSAPPDERDRGAPPASLGGKTARVLAIDDEPGILELVSDILQEGGCSVVTATSGREALSLYEPGKFDLVFCDLGMREMSGWEVVNAIRSRDSQVGIVLLTGWGGTLPEKRVQDYGIDAVMNKPFEMERMLRTVAQVMDLKETRARVTT